MIFGDFLNTFRIFVIFFSIWLFPNSFIEFLVFSRSFSFLSSSLEILLHYFKVFFHFGVFL